MKKKLSLNQLKVNSFVTSGHTGAVNTLKLKGGTNMTQLDCTEPNTQCNSDCQCITGPACQTLYTCDIAICCGPTFDPTGCPEQCESLPGLTC